MLMLREKRRTDEALQHERYLQSNKEASKTPGLAIRQRTVDRPLSSNSKEPEKDMNSIEDCAMAKIRSNFYKTENTLEMAANVAEKGNLSTIYI